MLLIIVSFIQKINVRLFCYFASTTWMAIFIFFFCVQYSLVAIYLCWLLILLIVWRLFTLFIRQSRRPIYNNLQKVEFHIVLLIFSHFILTWVPTISISTVCIYYDYDYCLQGGSQRYLLIKKVLKHVSSNSQILSSVADISNVQSNFSQIFSYSKWNKIKKKDAKRLQVSN